MNIMSEDTGNPLKVGLAGLGTVGIGAVKILTEHAGALQQKCGRTLELVAVSARNRGKRRDIDISPYAWFDDPVAMARAPEIDCIVEVIGGSDGPAKALVEAALADGKAVVTANKALLAEHGTALARLADISQAQLRYEAAVAGGIPVIKALREGLAANRITHIWGVLNGTCNYILTEMEKTGRDYADILADAQNLGYAEADPTADVGGFDAAHKLALLAAIGFGTQPAFNAVNISGIEQVSVRDITTARSMGYAIRLLAKASMPDGHLVQRVSACLVPASSDIGRLEGVTNVMIAEGDFVGRTAYFGPGAGEGPTASAIVADILDIARGNRQHVFGRSLQDLSPAPTAPDVVETCAYYLSLKLLDKPGALAQLAKKLGDAGVSIDRMLQQHADNGVAELALITHHTSEKALKEALKQAEALEVCAAPASALRIEEL